MMKREFRIYGLGLLSALLLSSCVTTTKTARTLATSASIKNATVADLRVTDNRVTYTMSPSKAIQRAGLNNVKQAAIQEALTKNGNADVMVEPEFVIEKERTLFGSRINSITVTGRPAYYQNFRTLPDSVWHKPGFYGQPDVVRVCSCNGDDCDDFGQKRGGIAGLVGKLSGKSKNKTRVERESLDGSLRRTGLRFDIDLMSGFENTRVKFSYNGGDDYTSNGSGYIGALGTIGLQTSPHWFFGVGSGFMNGWDYSTVFVPIFGDIRYYLSPANGSFFLDCKLGGSFQVGSVVIAGRSDSTKGGAFFSPSLGYSFGSFELSLQYILQDMKMENIYEIRGRGSHYGINLRFHI